jgi:hypothetical protein
MSSDDSATERQQRDRWRAKRNKLPPDSSSTGPELRAYPESSEGEEDIKEDAQQPTSHAVEDIEELKSDLDKLREKVDSMGAPRYCSYDPRGEPYAEVWIQCVVKKRVVPYRKSQGSANLQTRIIRIFKLKRQYWEPQSQRLGTDGEDG